MAIDNGVDLVGALPRLVDPLAVKSHDASGRSPQIAKARDVGARRAAFPSHRSDIWRNAVSPGKRSFETLGVRSGKGMVDKTIVSEMN
jgi:hypothetical protein